MKLIKKMFSGWDTSRIVKLVFAVALGISYLYNKETVFLMGAAILGLQAVLNISCPGGTCTTAPSKNEEPIVKVKKYKPENK